MRLTISKENADKNLSLNQINVHDGHAHEHHFSLSKTSHFPACVDKYNNYKLPKQKTTKYPYKIPSMCISKSKLSTE